MTYLIGGFMLCSIVSGVHGLTMWTTPENKAGLYVNYAILMAVQCVALILLTK